MEDLLLPFLVGVVGESGVLYTVGSSRILIVGLGGALVGVAGVVSRIVAWSLLPDLSPDSSSWSWTDNILFGNLSAESRGSCVLCGQYGSCELAEKTGVETGVVSGVIKP